MFEESVGGRYPVANGSVQQCEAGDLIAVVSVSVVTNTSC